MRKNESIVECPAQRIAYFKALSRIRSEMSRLAELGFNANTDNPATAGYISAAEADRLLGKKN